MQETQPNKLQLHYSLVFIFPILFSFWDVKSSGHSSLLFPNWMLRNFIQTRPKLAQGSTKAAQESGVFFFFHDGLSFSSSVHPSPAHSMSFQSAYSLSISFFLFFVCVTRKRHNHTLSLHTWNLNFNLPTFFFQVYAWKFRFKQSKDSQERDRKK